MDPIVASALVTGIVSLIIGVVTVRQNRQGAKATNALTSRVVDREDFETYVERMKEERERLDNRIEDLEKRLEKEVEARQDADERAKKAEDRAEQAEDRAIEADKRTARLERRVQQLEKILEENNIPVPPVL